MTVGVLAAAGCQRPAESRTRSIRAADLRQLALGHATPADVERVLGAPDAREPDAALVYASQRPARPGTATDEIETVTFRFRDGLLARICRSRSTPGS